MAHRDMLPEILREASYNGDLRDAKPREPASKAYLAIGFHAAADGMIAVDRDRRVVDVNPAFEAAMGYAREELLGQSVRMIYFDQQGFEAQGRTHVSPTIDQAGVDYHLHLRRKDGSRLSSQVTTCPVHEGDVLVGYVSVLRDQGPAERRTAFLQNVVSTCAEATLNVEQKVAFLLDLGLGYFGLTIGIVSAIEGDAYEVVHIVGGGEEIGPGSRFPLRQTYCEMVVGAGGPRAFHHAATAGFADHPCYEGTRLEAYIGTPILVAGKRYGTLNFSSPTPRSKPFSDEDLSLVMTLAAWIGNEIGIARNAAALVAERERFRRIYRKTPTLLHTLDANYRVTEVSDHWLRHLGYTFDEVRRRPIFDFVDPRSLDAARAAVPDYETAQYIERLPLVFEGRTGPVEVELSAVQDDTTTYAVMEDVSERNAAMRALATANEELSRLNESLKEFAYIASHDLQEPLRKITQFSSFLLEDHRDALPEEGRFFVDTLNASATRMSRLIHDLLAYSRTSNAELKVADVALSDVLADVICDFDVTVRRAEAVFEIGSLPVVRADPVQAEQLLRNLVGNALKYRAPDRAPRVAIAATDTGRALRVTVRDNGIGFDAKFAQTIFEPFKRLHGRSDYEGSGIGLSLCRAICERMRWDISAEGTPGRGAAFHVAIPHEDVVSPQIAASSP